MNKGLRDQPKSMVNNQAFDDGYTKIFGKTEVKRGSYRQDPETGKLLDAQQWYDKYGAEEKPRTAHIQCDIEPFISPASGKVVSSRSSHREDLKRTGCRTFEGRAQEDKATAGFRQQKDKAFDATVADAIDKTANDIKYNNTEVTDGPVNFTL